ncbi:uncharacterized protein LOC129907133 isoform X1 [Episyrphus balteatus]|uniref:uncharacterized protein LOC129907133 isoform X1 n=1 Tax=Episyrphus balteatus TaxID=286459 RepID=UPI002486BDE2|nr:uncharacterized protein LOC129907133 isoform X1 [Episyrphus balteatus]
MRKEIFDEIEKLNSQRTIWTKIRTSTFWEEEVMQNNNEHFKQHFRMSRDTFEVLCNEVRNLEKHDTRYRKSIPLRKRVAIAIYTLGSSAEYRTISALFGVGISTVYIILKTFCKEAWRVLHPKYLCAYPLTSDIIKENVDGFQKLGFPQCFGAIDGCHIEIQPPSQDAVDYYNYKGWYSMVLLAIVDYRYRFLYINVGSPGRCNDSQIFENSYVKEQHQQPILKEMSKNLCGVDIPVLLLGDSAFRLSEYLMKPYPFNTTATEAEKNFNYVLSKCRRVVENSFGHLKARFRRLGKGLDNRIDNSTLIIKTACVLHNFLNVFNDDINIQWLQNANNTLEREQPENITQRDDFLPTPSIIRNAITMHLDVDAPSSGDGDNGFSLLEHSEYSWSSITVIMMKLQP